MRRNRNDPTNEVIPTEKPLWKSRLRKWSLISLAVLVGLTIIGAIIGPKKPAKGSAPKTKPVTPTQGSNKVLNTAVPQTPTGGAAVLTQTTSDHRNVTNKLAENLATNPSAGSPQTTFPVIKTTVDPLEQLEIEEELGLPAKTVKRTVSEMYPNLCEDIVGDAQYPGGDLVSGQVRPQGDGLEISWTLSAPVILRPGETIVYEAKYSRKVGPAEWTQGSLRLFFFAQDGTIDSQVSFDIASPVGKPGGTMDVTADLLAETVGSTYRVWVPGNRIWAFAERGMIGSVSDFSPLTDGRWRLRTSLTTNTPGVPYGNDDRCGLDDSDSLGR
jgi:hypothetical protein